MVVAAHRPPILGGVVSSEMRTDAASGVRVQSCADGLAKEPCHFGDQALQQGRPVEQADLVRTVEFAKSLQHLFSAPWLSVETALHPFWFPRVAGAKIGGAARDCGRNHSAAAGVLSDQPQRGSRLLQDHFENPVKVRLGRQPRVVASAADAAQLLLDVDWPRRGPGHRDASETCIKVMEGTRSAVDARTAFVRAAREAGILVE